MTVYGAILSVVTRKIRAVVADVRAIVDYAKKEEELLVTNAEYRIQQIEHDLKENVTTVRNDLVAAIEKL